MVTKEERNTALRFIVCLGIVSLFADMTYEGAYSAIGPLFKELGASAAALGLVSGWAFVLYVRMTATVIKRVVLAK